MAIAVRTVAGESESYPPMFCRFLCLLLVSLMLANQGLCFAHSHHGGEPADHASQPHFHIGGHTHDHCAHADHSSHDSSLGEDDAAHAPAIAPISDHDADAVYFGGAVTFARDGNSVIVLAAKCIAVATTFRVADPREGWLQPPLVLDAACPISLRTLSLRI